MIDMAGSIENKRRKSVCKVSLELHRNKARKRRLRRSGEGNDFEPSLLREPLLLIPIVGAT